MRIAQQIIAFGCFMALCAAAKASVLNVSPTRLFISPSSQVEVIRLKNSGDEKALVEVEIFAWTDSEDGNALEPTEDFLIAPPIFEVLPETTQTLRLVPRIRDELDAERMYRVVISEVPSDVGPDNGVGFAVEMSLPIFMAPEGAGPKPEWALAWKDVATPELRVINNGDAHMRVRSFEIMDDVSDKAIFSSDHAAYVLPGLEQAWSLDDINFHNLEGPVILKALTTKGLIEAQLSLPNG
jgi:fimbrial chaperone protein